MSLQTFLLLLVVVAGILHPSNGSHFRGGILSWKPVASSSYKVHFTFRLGFRRSFSSSYYCDQNTVNNRGVVGSGSWWVARRCGSCGSMGSIGSVGYVCTDYSLTEDWSQGENSFTYTFSDEGPWFVGYSDCCWISLSLGGSNWYLSSTVNLTRRSDTGNINSSPVSANSPIVRLQLGCSKLIKILTEDPDGDKVRCRWAVGSSECGGACQAFKYGALDKEHCTIRYDGKGHTGWYAVALMLDDYPQSTNDFRAVSPFSSVGLQFLINIGRYSGSCYRKPYFTGLTPTSDSCIEINVNFTYRASLEVKHMDSARRVVEINVVAPTGVQTTAVGTWTDSFGEVVYQRNISWTPSSSQTDQNIFCFTALDNYGIESDKRCITILVGNNRASPVAILSSRYPSSSMSYSYYGLYDLWSIAFDRTIKKPRKSSFIRVYVNKHMIFKLETSSSPQVSVGGSNNTVLSFRTPRDVLSMRGTYSIILDAGSVVGRGCSSDGPPSPGITTPNLWTVYTSGYCSPGYYRGWNTGCVDVNECVNPAFRRRRSLSETKGTEAETDSARQKRNVYYSVAAVSPSPVMLPVSTTATPGECLSYRTFTSGDRSTHNLHRTWQCDYYFSTGWYRFMGNASIHMPEYCVSSGRCGTDSPGWLNGTHPNTYEGAVTRRVCYNYGGNCCGVSESILVRNCGGYYVYYLRPNQHRWPWRRCLRYCFEGSVSSSIQVTPSPSVQVSSSVSVNNSGVTAVRLVNGGYSYGRVEVFVNGEWGTVCDDYFGYNDARVFCRMLGFPGARHTAFYGQGSGRIWLDDLGCNGNEPSINDCYHRGVGNHNCGHSEDIGIVCAIETNSTVQVWPSPGQQVSSSIQVTPFPSVQVSSSVSVNNSGECSSYTTLSSADRSSKYTLNIYRCDYSLPSGWYRFTGNAGTQMPEYCVPHGRCGTSYPGWLNGTHPNMYEGVVRRQVCFNSRWHGNCCHYTRLILVRNCGAYYVYYLVQTSYYCMRYCGDGNSNVPSPVVNLSSTPAQMQITPTPLNSVAPSASTVYTPFVLHLPANCEHLCVNTASSYYCRCRAGYKLNPDGKTCSDIDECQVNNGGCSHHCKNVPGSYYCFCMEGQTISSDNKTCNEPGIEVTCEEEFMQIDLERGHFKNFDPTHLHLNYQRCRATSNSTHISLRTSLNNCGTTYNETDDEIRFDNVVKGEKLIIQGVVTRSFDVKIPFYCKYSKSKMLHVSFKPFGIITGYEGGFGNFTFRMDLFKSSAYRYPYAADDYPISVQLNQLLYIQYSVESLKSSLIVFADTCRATPSRDPYSSPQYVFLKNGCPEDRTIQFNYNLSPVQRFTMRAFQFLADYPIVYLHCHVMACHRNTVGSRCSQGCQRFIRNKRELMTESSQKKETQTYSISGGSIIVGKKSSKRSNADSAMTVIGSVSSAVGVLLITAIILAVIIIKRGYIKKFNRRNKVDDIYGREQGARMNAYVNEGNTAQGSELQARDKGFVVGEDIWVDRPSESGC